MKEKRGELTSGREIVRKYSECVQLLSDGISFASNFSYFWE